MSRSLGRTVAIVQARLGSSRLPMKTLLCLRGVPIIDWVTRRLSRAERLDGLVVAVPDTPLDAVLADHLRRGGVDCVAGPEADVLARMTLAARKRRADTIVRVCADNPLIWWKAVDLLVEHYENGRSDYAYNHVPRGNAWPDGLGAEICGREHLEAMDGKAALPSQREHCMNYIWDNPGDFAISTFDPPDERLRRPDLKLDIDSPEDFARMAFMEMDPDIDGPDIVRLGSSGRR
ncbi:MAG: NTP transferase domain-containing protein [Desulfovibrio sp.]|jgi:spore coat polysaccharide biosynthesis protein SpsF|nr:NTP transferase domain-containing protein [Desulfovibrio sp.]